MIVYAAPPFNCTKRPSALAAAAAAAAACCGASSSAICSARTDPRAGAI
jgi:hypothetical protein